MKIIHLTSAHDRNDTRIFLKMCKSLANNGFDTHLVVADGKGDEVTQGVNVFDVGAKVGGRLSRMTKTVNKVFIKALELNGDIYHLHDPELMPIGRKLKKAGKIVIFDAHEDLPKQIKSKPYLSKLNRILLSFAFEYFERFVCRHFDAVVTATPVIRDKFKLINSNSVDINNYPILGELASTQPLDIKNREREVCYLGGIAEIRGIKEVVEAFSFTENVRLNLVGEFSEPEVEAEVRSKKSWENVNDHGFLDRKQVADILSRSIAGLVTFHNVPNHVDAQPNKMFEYMSAGIPIITSNFPLWRAIVEGNDCGICVDPYDPQAIASAINELCNDLEKAEKLGANGKRAIEEKYNWAVEEKKLLALYNQLLGK